MSYGFGIIGLGLIADFHARAIEAMQGGRLVACCSRNQERADEFAKKYQCKGYSALEQFLSHPGLDIVNICTPSGAHLEPALAVAAAEKHLIVEKPLEITLSRCDQIIRACEENDVKLTSIFESRFFELTCIIKKAVEQGRFGQMVLCDAYIKWYRSQEYYDKGGWRGTWKLDGGGALMNQSIHAVDLLQYFAGEVEEVQALTETIGHERIEVEDNAVALLRFRSGALGVIEGSTSVYPGFLKRIELSGTKGSVIMEEEDLKTWCFTKELPEDREIRNQFISRTKSGGGASDPGSIDFRGHQYQFENMVEAIKNNNEPLINGYEARKAVEIILGIYKSAREGKKVKLPL